MNGLLFTVGDLSSSWSLLLIDSAIKGGVILLLAACAAMLLRRDSAATRHLVWLVAVVTVLFIPAFSALLPHWRVLPEWAAISSKAAEQVGRSFSAEHAETTTSQNWDGGELSPLSLGENDISMPAIDQPLVDEATAPPLHVPDFVRKVASSEESTQASAPAVAATPPWRWTGVLSVVWLCGIGVLILRLLAARLMLWGSERRCDLIADSSPPINNFGTGDNAADQSLIAEFEDSVRQLHIRQHVRLMIHPERSIPIVWGLWKFRLVLPAAAQDWSIEQQKSVLLHELAHIKRRDTLTQLLAQLACATYWFNPLVWYAAWRLHVERERACDDLVLCNGVAASAYAEHLLNVATRMTSASWTQACGLAMARRSSLEGRLTAVLSPHRNRHAVARVIVAVSLLLGGAIAVPVAMLRAAESTERTGENHPSNENAKEKPTAGSKLPDDIEKILKWGDPVNGLRAALSRLPSLGEEKPGYMDFDLVVQNVSVAPIRFMANAAAPDTRGVRIRKDGSTLQGLRSDKPSGVDYMLQPREVAVLQVFPPNESIRFKGRAMADEPEFAFYGQMEIVKAPKGAWSGKLRTPDVSGAAAKGDPMPNSQTAQALFKQWKANARLNGKIPGGQLRSLAKATSNFVNYNETDKRAPKLAELLKRMDVTRDWTQQEAVDLLNDVTDVYDDLPTWANDITRFAISDVIRTGKPLPNDLKQAPWGESHESGLRTAWLLDPSAKEHRLNTPLKSRILYHNNGTVTVVFRVVSWNQSGSHQAHDASGAKIETVSTDWTMIGQVLVCRLAPGEFTEVVGAGIGIGANNDFEDWRNTRVGTWIHAKPDDDVTFTPDVVTVSGNDGRQKEVEDSVWWLSFITQRLERDAPMPDDDKERQRILDRAVGDLFGTSATQDEIKTLLADKTTNAMSSLAKRLAQRSGTKTVLGQLQSGPTTFRVLPIDPDAKHKPHLAIGPGRYKFENNATLVIVGRGNVMDAKLEFEGEDASTQAYPITLPDGHGNWAIAWKRDMTTFWIAERGVLRSVDFSNPKQILEVRIGPDDKLNVSKHFLDALQPTYKPDNPIPPPASSAPAAKPPAADQPNPTMV